MSKERVQLITRNGEPEYAVLPYADYLELLQRAEGREASLTVAPVAPSGRMTIPASASVTVTPGATEPPFEPAELVRLRKRAGLSQSQLAKACKLGLMNLILLETGQRHPSPAMRAELARALGVAQL